jgi:hypothetical protein
MTNLFENDVKVIRFLDNYRGVLTGECFFTSGTIVDTENAPVEIDHSGLVEAERAEYVEGDELGDNWFFDPNQVVEVEAEEAEEIEEVEVDETPELDLEGLSVKQLKARAKELGLSGYSKLGKDDLIAAIRE